jgi:hypothetical protein
MIDPELAGWIDGFPPDPLPLQAIAVAIARATKTPNEFFKVLFIFVSIDFYGKENIFTQPS